MGGDCHKLRLLAILSNTSLRLLENVWLRLLARKLRLCDLARLVCHLGAPTVFVRFDDATDEFENYGTALAES